MAIVREQYKVGQGNGNPSLNVTFDTNVTANSLLLCVVSADIGTSPYALSVSDNNSNTWTEVYDNNYNSNDVGFIAYVQGANSGSTTVTVTGNGSTWFTIVIIEVSGIETTGALDQSNEATGNSSSPDSGNITTTQADEYIIGGFAEDDGNRTITEDGAFTLIFEEQNQSSDMVISVIERIVSSTLTESASWSLNSAANYWAGVASFKAVAGAAADGLQSNMRIMRLRQAHHLRR